MSKSTTKYRSLTVIQSKRNEDIYFDLKLNSTIRDERLITTSRKWILVGWHSTSGGTLGLLSHVMDLGKRGELCVKIDCHGAQITDIGFCPFDCDMFVTACGDGTMKIWQIPSSNIRSDTIKLQSTIRHGKKSVNAVSWHPTTLNILASGGDEGIKIWVLEEGAVSVPKISLDIDGVQSLCWNYDGSLLAFASKDRFLRIFDPRKNSVVAETEAYAGNEIIKLVWLGNTGKIATTGRGKLRDRVLTIWNALPLEMLGEFTVDPNPGALHILYDHGAGLLWTYGRGDTIIKGYELLSEKPYLRGLNPTNTVTPYKALELVPRQLLDFDNCEVARMLKVTQNSIIPIIIKVPRGKTNEFREDLYPTTPAQVPALVPEAWFSGSNADPILESLKPKEPEPEPEPEIEKDNLEDDDDWYIPKDFSMVRSTHYRHIFGRDMNASTTSFLNLKVNNNASLSHTLRVNKKFFMVAWEGVGGKIGVFKLDKPGRIDPATPFIETGFEVHDFDCNPFDPHVLAIGGDTGSVQVWQVPEEGLTGKGNLHTPKIQLRGHKSKITTVDFHPTYGNVLVSTSADEMLKLWDISTENEKYTVQSFNVINVTWNPTGDLVATCSKDDAIRFFDIRQQTQIHQGSAMGSPKGSRVEWLEDKNQIFCVGFTNTNERRLKIMDLRKLDTEITSQHIDYGVGSLYTHYEEGMNVMALWGKGDSTIKFFEISDTAPHCHWLTDYTSLVMQVGIGFLPKSLCNVKEVEFTRVLKLTNNNTVEQIQFFVPRTRKEYFQDDIFPPTGIRAEEPTLMAEEFFEGKTAEPKRVDLNPGLPLFSTAPKIVHRMKKVKVEDLGLMGEEELKESAISGVYNKMMTIKDTGKEEELSHEKNEGVDPDEWSD